VKASINEVVHTLLIALLLVIFVVYLFLQNWRATLIPVLAIPVSLIGTFILFNSLGFTINTLTLFAFVLVCGGVLLIPAKEKQPGKFHLPYINGQFIFPLIVAGAMILAAMLSENYFANLFHFDFSGNADYMSGRISFMEAATPNISLIIFWLSAILLSLITFVKKYSLIPLMGLITCMYLLTGMTKSNWAWFLGWLAIGLVIYFLYGYKNSKLRL
jgi:hypothetical protein